jgi:hypothetical protein
VLIALSARSIGATVVTQNERDFRAIQTIRPFRCWLSAGCRWRISNGERK